MWRLSITNFLQEQNQVVFDIALQNWIDAYQLYFEKAGNPKQLSAHHTCIFDQADVVILDRKSSESCRMKPGLESDLSTEVQETPKYSLAQYLLVAEREKSSDAQFKITAKEKIFVMQSGTKEEQGEFFVREQLEDIQKQWAKVNRGQFVNLIVFDHLWKERPARPPLVVLQWKDWNDKIEVEFPIRQGLDVD